MIKIIKSRVWIICSNSPGLVNDAAIIADCVKRSNSVVANIVIVPRNKFYRVIKILHVYIHTLFESERSQIGIFLEDIRPFWLRFFSKTILIPNPEHIHGVTARYLKSINEIWCKTLHAVSIFESRVPGVCYINFSSRDRYIPEIKKDYGSYLHVQGKSTQKGTIELLDVWSSHPEWPSLTVVSRDHDLKVYSKHNIKLIFDFLSDDDLSILMNSCGVHICPSTVEGFGHYINEAMSCASVVLTTNAPPMNELVVNKTGFLVEAFEGHEMGFAKVVKLNAEDLEVIIQRIIDLTHDQCSELGRAARISFEMRHNEFSARFVDLIGNID